MFTAEELLPIKLTLELALITTVFLLLVATPLAWWLSHTKSKWRAPISSIVTLRSCDRKYCLFDAVCRPATTGGF